MISIINAITTLTVTAANSGDAEECLDSEGMLGDEHLTTIVATLIFLFAIYMIITGDD